MKKVRLDKEILHFQSVPRWICMTSVTAASNSKFSVSGVPNSGAVVTLGDFFDVAVNGARDKKSESMTMSACER